MFINFAKVRILSSNQKLRKIKVLYTFQSKIVRYFIWYYRTVYNKNVFLTDNYRCIIQNTKEKKVSCYLNFLSHLFKKISSILIFKVLLIRYNKILWNKHTREILIVFEQSWIITLQKFKILIPNWHIYLPVDKF